MLYFVLNNWSVISETFDSIYVQFSIYLSPNVSVVFSLFFLFFFESLVSVRPTLYMKFDMFDTNGSNKLFRIIVSLLYYSIQYNKRSQGICLKVPMTKCNEKPIFFFFCLKWIRFSYFNNSTEKFLYSLNESESFCLSRKKGMQNYVRKY